VQGDGSSLLGRDWLLHLRLDWKEIHHLQTTDPVERILLKHEVFRKGLGTLRGYKAMIYVDKQATPRFCKARSVPYSLRVKMEEELNWFNRYQSAYSVAIHAVTGLSTYE